MLEKITKTRLSRAVQLGAFMCAVGVSNHGFAIPLIDITGASGGAAGYGELAMNANDDSSSNMLNLNFTANFFGTDYNQFYVNNNGNITFNAPLRGFTPTPFPVASQPMIAPFWADVDTRGTGEVYVAAPNENTTIITWNDVGYFSNHTDPTNNFQLILRDRSDETGMAGDFDIEFRYDRLDWTTGDASGGSEGQGGTPAQAGFDAGNGDDYFVLPGSLSADVVDLQNQTNVVGGENGLWVFAIRGGATPGETPENPILPVIADGSYNFEFGVDLNETVFIDPEVAIGYDYQITDPDSPLFASVVLPAGFDDDAYELYLWNDLIAEWEYADTLLASVVYEFGQDGVDRFRIQGIEEYLAVDPTDPLAFVTGLTFTDAGTVVMSQTPLVVDTDADAEVPEPGSLALFALGLTALGFGRRKALNA